ncbi:MAG: AraC family transcriptional regulator [Bacteroidales bacterium]|nr:AraC family transcriptional regulator [Bacteroidales bacterium]
MRNFRKLHSQIVYKENRNILQTFFTNYKNFENSGRNKKGKKNDWFELFYKYGYYDQSHFIKDFKKITGKTPNQYFKTDKTYSHIFSALSIN